MPFKANDFRFRGIRSRMGHGAKWDLSRIGMWAVLMRPGASLLRSVSAKFMLHVVNIAAWQFAVCLSLVFSFVIILKFCKKLFVLSTVRIYR